MKPLNIQQPISQTTIELFASYKSTVKITSLFQLLSSGWITRIGVNTRKLSFYLIQKVKK